MSNFTRHIWTSTLIGCLLIGFSGLAQEKKRIELKHADVLEYDESLGHKARRLIGNVQFEHEGTLMDCDSAYLYENNSLDAFSNVEINKGDSVFMFCQKLFYDGNTKLARAREKVKLDDGDMELYTEFLNHDLNTDVAQYFHGGTIYTEKDTLTSQIGNYYTEVNDFYFKNNVELRNPQYVMNCDTLKFNTASEIAYFLGPTTIVADANTIVCKNGWYDTKLDLSQFNEDAVIHGETQSITGDSLFYDRNLGYGKAICNVKVVDTVEHVILEGDFAEYYDSLNKVIMVERALLKQKMDADTLYLHGDTLLSYTDTISDQRILFAYHHVQFFKDDMQGRCDSLVYSYVDSTINLYTEPVLWSDENQLTADSIWIQMKDSKIDRLFMRHNSMIVSEEDSAMFNQIKGRHMVGQFENAKLRTVNVNGNGQTIYFTGEEGRDPDSVNKSESSDLVIRLDSNRVDQITFLTQPKATLYPLSKVNLKEMQLEGFSWRTDIRPTDRWSIFEWEAVLNED